SSQQSVPAARNSSPRSLPLRHPAFLQALDNVLIFRQERGIVRPALITPAIDRVIGHELLKFGKRDLCLGSLTGPTIGGDQIDISSPVGIQSDRPSAPLDRQLVLAKMDVSVASPIVPDVQQG